VIPDAEKVQFGDHRGQELAPRVGLEPTTNGLTDCRSQAVYLGKRTDSVVLGHVWATADPVERPPASPEAGPRRVLLPTELVIRQSTVGTRRFPAGQGKDRIPRRQESVPNCQNLIVSTKPP
jgi:hypothetical protein